MKKSKNKDIEIVKNISNDENKTEIQLSEKRYQKIKNLTKKLSK